MRGADFTIWVVAFLFYLCDAARFLSRRELLLVEAGTGRLATTISDHPFTITGRELTFGPVLLPHRGAFVARWGRTWSDTAGLRSMLASLEQLRRSLLPVRILAALAFGLLFVVGPALTRLLGVDAAVVYTAGILYPTVLVAIACLWWRRRTFRLPALRCLWLSVEILVCPAFMPNLVRKITASPLLEADALQILLASGSPDVDEEFLTRLERRAEELFEDAEPDGQDLRAYLATVRSTVAASTLDHRA